MTSNQISKYLTIYFVIVLIISIAFTFLNINGMGVYGPLFYMIFGVVVLFANYQIQFYSFSRLVKQHHPLVFKNNTLGYSVLKNEVISTWSLFNNSIEYNGLSPKEHSDKYKLVIKSLKLTIVAFFLLVLLAIGSVYA